MTVIYPSEKIDMFSRNGKELNNFNHIKDEINKKFDTSTINEALILDGEVISDDFQTLMKQIHRKNSHKIKMHSCFYSYVTFREFQKGIFERPYFLRIDELKGYIKNTSIKVELSISSIQLMLILILKKE